MNDQNETTTTSPSEPKLCKMGCGFFFEILTREFRFWRRCGTSGGRLVLNGCASMAGQHLGGWPLFDWSSIEHSSLVAPSCRGGNALENRPALGSNATGDCCSKCYNEILKKEGGSTATQPTTPSPAPVAVVTSAPINTATTTPVVEALTVTNANIETAVAEPEKKKKKKKKMSYKNMMAGMLEQSGPRDVEMEKEGIKKVTGGGAFSKIDKI
ncbi:hypothetical protein ACHAXM_006193 [Skeletonema potamos]